MANSLAYKHYQRALSQWPIDLLRPEMSFQKAMRRRIDMKFHLSNRRPQDNVVGNGAEATVPAASKPLENAEIEQVNVLYSFLEDRYLKKYPISEYLMKPTSNPTYYKDLMEELQQAPGRSWFASFTNKWKGFLRMS